MPDISVRSIFDIHKYQVEYRDWHSIFPRQHHFLAYEKEGCVIHTLKGCRELVASPDTVLFLNKDDYFEAHAEEFGYSIVAELELDNAPESFLVDFSGDNSMSNLFTAMLNCRNDNLASNRYRALGTIYEIFGLISRREEAEYMTSSTEGKLYAMRLYIQEHYSDPTLNMEKLSGISGLSIRHLNVLFNKKYDSSCWQYVIDTRINAASKLLCAPGYSIGMVAEQCDFRDVYYFRRLFKKHMNVSPKEYRLGGSGRE